MLLSEHFFRTYDLRGIYNKDMDDDGIYIVIRCFSEYITSKLGYKPTILVCGDGRESTLSIKKVVLQALYDSGLKAHFGGIKPTPYAYYGVYSGMYDASIMISASHNPAVYNGLKLFDKYGKMWNKENYILRDMSFKSTITPPHSYDNWLTDYKYVDYTEEYVAHIRAMMPTNKRFKIAVDSANAVTGTLYPHLLRLLGHTVYEINTDLDGTFPLHEPDPSVPHHLLKTADIVKNMDIDYCFCYDGDGDRVGVITGTGEILPTYSTFLGVIAYQYLHSNPTNKRFCTDIMVGANVHTAIKNWGGEVIISKTGHASIMETMRHTDTMLACEFSAHVAFGVNSCYDDALIATQMFLKAVENTPDVVDIVKKSITPVISHIEEIPLEDAKKHIILDRVQEKLLIQYPQATTIDGIRVDINDAEWAIIRASNSSPNVRIRVDALTKERLDELLAIFKGVFEEEIRIA